MTKKIFLKNMNYLRGFAILNIIIIHIWTIPILYVEDGSIYPKIINVTKEILFHDSSIYFIFISGFFLKYLSFSSPLQYYKIKLKTILLPYIFLSSTLFFLRLFIDGIEFPLTVFFRYIFMGEAQVQYWYIPFIATIFLISPVLLKIPNKTLLLMLPILLILPLIGTRTGTIISLGQYVYFLPIYILGILCAANYERFMALIERRLLLLISAIITSTFLIIIVMLFEPKFLFVNLYESFHYLQKISILLFFIVFFKRIEHIDINILNVFAKYSFALFFVHFFINSLLDELIMDKYYELFSTSTFLIIPISILYTLISIFLSLLFCIVIKKLLGYNSRYIIGV
jgi:surface polysaccharide O-acyltransferase-like enzyme